MKTRADEVTDDVIEARKRTGAHRWDERWDGVWHLMPLPTCKHQDVCGGLYLALRRVCGHPNAVHVHLQVNVARPGRWPHDYRGPDIVLLKPDRFGINKDAFFDGGPNIVVEVQSPRDESLEKLPFYDDIGVEEVWIIDAATKAVLLFARIGADGGLSAVKPRADGWVPSAVAGVELKTTEGGEAEARQLLLRVIGQEKEIEIIA